MNIESSVSIPNMMYWLNCMICVLPINHSLYIWILSCITDITIHRFCVCVEICVATLKPVPNIRRNTNDKFVYEVSDMTEQLSSYPIAQKGQAFSRSFITRDFSPFIHLVLGKCNHLRHLHSSVFDRMDDDAFSNSSEFVNHYDNAKHVDDIFHPCWLQTLRGMWSRLTCCNWRNYLRLTKNAIAYMNIIPFIRCTYYRKYFLSRHSCLSIHLEWACSAF